MENINKRVKEYNKMIKAGKTSTVYYNNRGESILIWKDTPENDKGFRKIIAGVF